MEDWTVIHSYTWQQAVEDGELVELVKHRWPELTNGKPILATAHLSGEVSLAGLMEIYNAYVIWQRTIMPTLKEQDRMFTTMMNGKDVWVIDDSVTITLLYPSDY